MSERIPQADSHGKIGENRRYRLSSVYTFEQRLSRIVRDQRDGVGAIGLQPVLQVLQLPSSHGVSRLRSGPSPGLGRNGLPPRANDPRILLESLRRVHHVCPRAANAANNVEQRTDLDRSGRTGPERLQETVAMIL